MMNNLLPTLNFNDPKLKENPYPIYQQYRDCQPVFWAESSQAWVFMRYDDVHDLLNDSRVSAKQSQSFLERSPTSRKTAIKPVVEVISRCMGVGENDFAHVRKLFNPGFTRTVIDNLAPVIRQVTTELLDDLEGRRQLDVSTEFAHQLPIRILARLLCISPAEQTLFKRWSKDIHSFINPVPITEAACDRVLSSMLSLISHLHQIVAEQRQEPDNEFLSFLIQAEVTGEVLRAADLLANLVFLLVAGEEPVGHLISNAMNQVLQHPDILQRGLIDSTLWERIVEESIRYDAPFQIATRITREPMMIGDVIADEGQMLYLMIGSATHDETHFSDAERFDIDREAMPRFTFGSGPNYRLGLSLARVEAAIALEMFFERFPDAHPHPFQSKQWVNNTRFRGLSSLPVVC